MTQLRKSVLILVFLVGVFFTTTNVFAQIGAPTRIGGAYFLPSSISFGDSTALYVENLQASAATTTVGLCFYYTDAGLDILFSPSVVGSQMTTYVRDYQGPEAGSVHCPPIGFPRVTEYSGTPTAEAKLLGEDFDFPGNIGIANGVYPVEIFELEDTFSTDKFSASLTVIGPPQAPPEVYVSNTSGCGGYTPCYTGGTALQQAFDQVADGGSVFVYGAFSQGGGATAVLAGNKSVTIYGFNNPIIENGGGTCSGAMINNQSSGTLTFTAVTLDGTCALGTRSAGILQSGSGTTIVKDSFSTIRDFTVAGTSALRVTNGELVAFGNGFQNNHKAFDQTGGTLYAFANNIHTNLGSQAATRSAGAYNVTCNYWSAATIAGFGTDYIERLGAPVVNYIEGAGPQTLGTTSLAENSGTQVIIGLGRAVNPFGNGTVIGLGARVSDYYAVCGTRASAVAGAITIASDLVTPGDTGFRLYSITDPMECSPASNTACWDYQNVSCNLAGCSLTGSVARDGHFVVGNELDPTAVTLQSFSRQSSLPLWPIALVMMLLAGTAFMVIRRREA